MTDNLFGIPQPMRYPTEHISESMGASIGTNPTPMLNGLKDVRERAMDFAADNAESTYAFAGKICSAKTTEEILSLQSGFTQDRINAIVAQMRELQRLVEQAVQRPA